MTTQRETRLMVHSLVSIIAVLLFFCTAAIADMASPHLIHETQPDGTTIALHIRGSHVLNWQEDLNGYTVVRELGNSGRYVYARQGPKGHLIPTPFEVGKANPKALGLKKRILPSPAVIAQMRASSPEGQSTEEAVIGQPELSGEPQILKNLVVLIRFADHAGRTIPLETDIDVLMNALGGHPTLAPGGSLKDIYLNNSYGALTIDSTVVAWATITMTEAEAAGGESGLTTTIHAALAMALDIVDATIDFSQFDQDADGYIDAITFLHSGYGAEWGGTDTYGTYYTNRIWSHKWSLWSLEDGYWSSNEGVRVYNYHISPALWGTSGSALGRIGVIAHETGHFLGLPDLYDTDGGGEGIGSWGLMANSWGDDGSQQPPPLMSAWSKIQMGWVLPEDLSAPGNYQIHGSLNSDVLYKISDGYPDSEYLLIENRRRTDEFSEVVDNIPSYGDGLVIYHIDDKAGFNTEGYPGQVPSWPENGMHYRVAVLQADGNYNLEKGDNRGDRYDTYREGHVDLIGPASSPSTDSYQYGDIIPTGHEISSVSSAASTMTFDFNIGQLPADPPVAPILISTDVTGHYSIDLGWQDNSDNEQGFILERSLSGTGAWGQIADLPPNSVNYSDTGLLAGTEYDYRIMAWNSAGDSGYSNIASAMTTIPEPPTAPTGLTAAAISDTQIDLSWTNGENAAGLEIQRGLNDTDFETIATPAPSESSYTDSNLLASTTYYYRVLAVNSDGSAFSNVDFAETEAPSPKAFAFAEISVLGTATGDFYDTHAYDDGISQVLTETLSATNKNARSHLEHVWQIDPVAGGLKVVLSINASPAPDNEGTEGFTFAYSLDGLTYTDFLTVDSVTYGLQIAELPASAVGTVYLRVQDNDRSRAETTTDTILVDYLMIESFGEVVLSAPANVNGTAISSSQVKLTWDDANGEDQYIVQYKVTGSGDWTTAKTAINNLPANTTQFTVEELDPLTSYDFRVGAADATSQVLYGNIVTVETLEVGTQNDTVTIVTAEYKAKAKLFLVEATSSMQPGAVLTLEEFGTTMTWSAADNVYIYKAKENFSGQAVTVTSDLGGSATADVIYK